MFRLDCSLFQCTDKRSRSQDHTSTSIQVENRFACSATFFSFSHRKISISFTEISLLNLISILFFNFCATKLRRDLYNLVESENTYRLVLFNEQIMVPFF